jgi:uncharacterized protein YbjT (DUF2867 family)
MSEPLLVGATGMVGQAVIRAAAGRPLRALVRKPLVPADVRHHATCQPTGQWPDVIAIRKPPVVVSCLGTTIREAGSQQAFRAIDYDLILAVATAAKASGTTHFIAVSSVGASAKSRNFYLKTKGETENGLRSLGFDRLDLLRPGLLTGDREGPRRLGEGIAAVAAPLTDALLHGSLRRYRSVPGDAVARAIVALLDAGQPGVHIHENDAIRALAD